jgi:hypothetical protein
MFVVPYTYLNKIRYYVYYKERQGKNYYISKGGCFRFFKYCKIFKTTLCASPSDSTVSEDAGIELRTQSLDLIHILTGQKEDLLCFSQVFWA